TPPSNSLGYDHLRVRSRLPQGLGFRVFGRRPPRLRLLQARELDDDEPLWRPVSLERLRLAAADDEPPAVLRERRGDHGAVIRVPRRILHVDLNDYIGSHYSASSAFRLPSSAFRLPSFSSSPDTRFSMKNSIMRCALTFECPWSGPTCTSKLFPACCNALINCSEFDGCTLLSDVP